MRIDLKKDHKKWQLKESYWYKRHMPLFWVDVCLNKSFNDTTFWNMRLY